MSYHLIRPDIDLDFVGKRHFFVALSTAINIAAIVLLLTVGLNYGVDFAGGSVVQLEFAHQTNGDAIRAALKPLDLGEIESFETMLRNWHVKGMSVRPVHRMVAHSAFIIVSRRLVAPSHSVSVKPIESSADEMRDAINEEPDEPEE